MDMPSAYARGTNAALLDVRARLRPMGIDDILDETIDLYRRNVVLFVATTGALLVPLLLLGVVVALGVAFAGLVTEGADGPGGLGPIVTLLFVVVGIAGFVGALLVAAALTVAASRRYLGQPCTVRGAYAAGLKRLWPLLLAALWAAVRLIPIAAIGAFLIGIPFLFYYGVAWLLIPQVVVLEGRGAGAASGRSRRLVEGHWWRAFGLYLALSILLNILAAIPTLLLTAVVGGIIGAATGSAAALVVVYAVASVVVPALLAPLALIAATLLFYDLKVRKEAFDLEAMAWGVGLPPYAGPTMLQ